MSKDGGWFWLGFWCAMPIGVLCGGVGAILCYHVWDFGTGVLAGIVISGGFAFLTYAYLSEHLSKNVGHQITLQIKRNLVDWYEQQEIDTDDSDWWKHTDGKEDYESGGPD